MVSFEKNDAESYLHKREQKSQQKTSKPILAYALAILAAVAASFGALYSKMFEGEKMMIILFRCIVQYLTILPIMNYKKVDVLAPTKKIKLYQLLFGVCAMSGIALLTESYNYLTVGDAVAIFYTFPALTIFFARIFLKEECGILNTILTVVALSGVVLVAEPSFIFGDSKPQEHSGFSRVIGVILGLGSAMLVALSAILMRIFGRNLHFSEPLFYSAWEGIILIMIYFAATGKLVLPCYQDVGTGIAAAVFSYLNLVLVAIAVQYEKVGPLSLVLTSQVIFSFFLQYIFLGAVPTLLGAVGAGMILLSSVAIAVKNVLQKPTSK